jgi:hypothetical protein
MSTGVVPPQVPKECRLSFFTACHSIAQPDKHTGFQEINFIKEVSVPRLAVTWSSDVAVFNSTPASKVNKHRDASEDQIVTPNQDLCTPPRRSGWPLAGFRRGTHPHLHEGGQDHQMAGGSAIEEHHMQQQPTQLPYFTTGRAVLGGKRT